MNDKNFIRNTVNQLLGRNIFKDIKTKISEALHFKIILHQGDIRKKNEKRQRIL